MKQHIYKRSVKQWFNDTSYEIKVWWDNNKEWAAIVVPIAIPCAVGLTKKIISTGASTYRLHLEDKMQTRRIYDHSLGMYWTLKRSLNSNDMLSIERRRKAGEKMGDILSSMRLI